MKSIDIFNEYKKGLRNLKNARKFGRITEDEYITSRANLCLQRDTNILNHNKELNIDDHEIRVKSLNKYILEVVKQEDEFNQMREFLNKRSTNNK